jgi:hypothetical protein
MCESQFRTPVYRPKLCILLYLKFGTWSKIRALKVNNEDSPFALYLQLVSDGELGQHVSV